jgi:hypothetical protein
MQAAWDQTLFRPFERYLFARFRDMKSVTIRDFHPLYDSGLEPFGFHELPFSLSGVTV